MTKRNGFVSILIVSFLFFGSFVCYGEPMRSTQKQISRSEDSSSLHIPEWVSFTPRNCFVGISGFCQSFDDARNEAIQSAISHILQSMGAEYRLTHASGLSGTADHSTYVVREQLVYRTQWFLQSVQQSIQAICFEPDHGNVMCFVLVYFPPAKLERLRKLTRGPHLTAKVVHRHSASLDIMVSETNGVTVTLTDYRLTITTKNHYSGIISLFLWNVPESLQRECDGVISGSLVLKGNSQKLSVSLPADSLPISNRILGAERHVQIELKGYDERGRHVLVTAKDQ